MSGLIIENQQLVETLRRLAEQENRSVEALLVDLVEQHQRQQGDDLLQTANPSFDSVERLRKLAYNRARRYWREIGDTTKAGFTDEQLEEQGLRFDENDIPRLNIDKTSGISSPLAHLAGLARQAQLPLGDEAVSSRSDEILQDEFADYLLNQPNRQDFNGAS